MPEYIPNARREKTSWVVTLDIETIPTTRLDVIHRLTAQARAPSNYKDPAKIAAACDEKAKAMILDTALSGLFGEAWCICWAVDDEPPEYVTRKDLDDPEDALIAEFYAKLEHDLPITFQGHNILWDVRFLWQRSLVHRIEPPLSLPVNARPWDPDIQDTMVRWCGASGRDYVSLGNLCTALGVECADEISGSDVWNYVQAGDWQKVVNHCLGDVIKARECWQRMQF